MTEELNQGQASDTRMQAFKQQLGSLHENKTTLDALLQELLAWARATKMLLLNNLP
ncbi:uncharacterized protein G2W53_022207 [Senna tora]|uniref:Uncharacterized protein n=1 Tax=Senna tora TaxID=362788 RepID=A0A834TKU5_9FABA|nr:uncharacterized protein G2W53_022207 [Senna tora]